MSWVFTAALTAYLFFRGLGVLEGSEPTPLFLLGCVALTTILIVQVRRDPYVFAGYVLLVSGFTSFLGYAFVAADEPERGMPVMAAAAGVFVLTGCYMLWREHGPDPFFNYLRQTFDKRHISELGGVQIVVEEPHFELVSGQTTHLNVYAQNGYDAPRTLHVRVTPERKLTTNPATLLVPHDPHIDLAPGAAGLLVIPITAEPAASGRYTCLIRASVEGTSGRRLRRWRAPPFDNQLNIGVGLLLLAQGVLGVLKQGMRIKFEVRRDPEAIYVHSAKAPSTKVLWAPNEDELG